MGRFKQNGQSGQILLVVVLAAVISLTVGLAAVSRTTTNTKVSTEEANSQKALSAAEAGIEQLIQDKTLVQQSNPTGTPGVFSGTLGGAVFNATVTNISGLQILINGGETVSMDDGADVWLSDYPTYTNSIPSTTLTIYWNDISASNCTALEVMALSGPTASPTIKQYAYDKCTGTRGNNFDSNIIMTSKTIQGKTFNRHVALPAITSGLVVRIVPLYSNTSLAVESTALLPNQGSIIESLGTSGNTSRKIRSYQVFPKLPTELFPYSIFEP